MSIPFFYITQATGINELLVLDEDTSKHVVQVLRMQNGEQLHLTDGKGNLYKAAITDNNRKRCTVQITHNSFSKRSDNAVTIAISPVKNNSRFEWFLEKATEIGIDQIIPLICSRTEKQHFRFDRMQSILISAMLQSQQCWMPVLHEPVKFEKLVTTAAAYKACFIAHCEDENNKLPLQNIAGQSTGNKIILIGPEGDFTHDEINLALQNHFTTVALGDTRLRTETAGIVAATLLRLLHQ